MYLAEDEAKGPGLATGTEVLTLASKIHRGHPLRFPGSAVISARPNGPAGHAVAVLYA